MPEMSPAVERALESAQKRAALQGAVETSPAHLFAALIEEEEGRASVLLTGSGLDRGALMKLCPDSSDNSPRTIANCTIAPICSGVESALGRARELALDLAGEHVVASEHLLIALLEADAVLRTQLLNLGLNLPALQNAVRGNQDELLPVEELDIRDPTDWVDAARILDANANRAREGLRVVEDYCRFVLDDPFLVQELKQIRHSLGEALESLPIQARDTEHDVGVTASTAREGLRSNPRQVLRANASRVQEALRSLEEYAKFVLPGSGRAFEQLRYRFYTLERTLLTHEDAIQRLAQVRLYVLLTRGRASTSIEWIIQEAASAGAGMFQLREKDYCDRELLQVARDVRRWTRATKTLFIVNDRPDIARLVDADGVHLGQDDMSVKDARRVLGGEAIIGVSTHSVEDIGRAIVDGATYLGVGPTFSSGTKSFDQLAGLEFIREAASLTTLPWFAIGGIDAANVSEVVGAGASRIAVSQAVIGAAEPGAAAAQLVGALARS